jgi:hypothetical protein
MACAKSLTPLRAGAKKRMLISVVVIRLSAPQTVRLTLCHTSTRCARSVKAPLKDDAVFAFVLRLRRLAPEFILSERSESKGSG